MTRDGGYTRIVQALDEGRSALKRARLTAGVIRFLGIALATVAALVLWAVLQRFLRFYSVPVATLASVIGAGVLVFGLVRWVIVPLVRLPGRDDFVKLVEERYPDEKNVVVNAYQLGAEKGKHEGSGDLIDALVARATDRVGEMDLRRWRDPAPDRPYLWAGGAALLATGLLAVLSPSLLTGALGQVLRPGLAAPPPVNLVVSPGSVEVERGSDLDVTVSVTGTGKAPMLHFRERNGAWRERELLAADETSTGRDGGLWATSLEAVDRTLEYRVTAPRAETDVFTVRVKEPPRIAGYRMHLDYPDYTGLPGETVEAGGGDVAALRGTNVDLRILTNRSLPEGHLEWRPAGEEGFTERPLERVDDTTWRVEEQLLAGADYSVVFTDGQGGELARSPRYRMEATPDRAPYLTVHLPQEDHDLYEDMMERIVADAADDFGFSAVRVVYRVDDGPERWSTFDPFTARQKEFRLDTLWDLGGIGILPGQTLAFYLEVRDNDGVTGPKAVRSDVYRVRFPTVAEMYEEVAEDQGREIEGLSEIHEEQAELRERLQELTDDLKSGKDMNWELQQDLKNTLEKQEQLEQQVSEAVSRLEETISKANDRAQMNSELVQKMTELNELLENVANEDMKRAFEQLSNALAQMDPNQIRSALENFQTSQEQMLAGLDRTIELLKQVKKEAQVEDVVRRTEEIARLQEELTEELKEMGAPVPEPGEEAKDAEAEAGDDAAATEPQDPGDSGEESASEAEQARKDAEAADPADADPSGEQPPGETPDAEPGEGEQGESASPQEQAGNEATEALEKQIDDLKERIAEERKKLEEKRAEAQKAAEQQQGGSSSSESGEQQQEEGSNSGETSQAEKDAQAAEAEMQKRLQELEEAMEKLREKQAEQLAQDQGQGQQQNQQGSQQSGDQQQQSGQQGQQGEQGQQNDGQQGGQQASPEQKEKLAELAKKQEALERQVEDLKRQLEMLQKLNEEDQPLAEDLQEMERSEAMKKAQQGMQSAAQSMAGGQMSQSSKYAFEAKEQMQQLAQMAQEMQQQMGERLQDENVAKMEAIIQGLIDVSGVEETLFDEGFVDDRELAARQYALAEKAEAISDSLAALSRQSMAVTQEQSNKLSDAIRRMENATRYYELGNLRSARHEGRESAGDLNETIVELMQSHSTMCSGSGGGSQMQQMMQKMQGLSEAQQQLNEQTGRMQQEMEGQGRPSMTQQQRMEWLAAQQEMIRQGLQEVKNQFDEAKELLGDMDTLTEEMTQVEQVMRDHQVDRRVLERQQQILSRLLDAQRSMRQQEISPERESRTGTLAQRTPPPPIPDELMRGERTLEEDLLRGAADRYPVQYRSLVETYFRQLAKEERNP